ncbi:MAG: hypothetical protein HY000_09390 [Planctomycetes bacterium]|nr:hypothetical protein [Planctomycetota bacterium]
MGLQKRTYALPGDTLAKFEQSVPSGNRSAVLAGLMSDWLDRQRRERMREEVIQGCIDMREEYLRIEQEYHPLEEEAARALDSKSRARRGRARQARPRRRV